MVDSRFWRRIPRLFIGQVHKHPHHISTINGYTVDKDRFENTNAVEEVVRTAHSIFRISDRRRSQVPAMAFLVSALAKPIPHGIRTAHFCQGSVREGVLFWDLPPSIRVRDPLEVATTSFAPASAARIFSLLKFSVPLPLSNSSRHFPDSFTSHVIRAFANTLYVHAVMDKELASISALYSTSTGLMSSTHCVSYEDRAKLAFMLESRYMGELPPRELEFKEALRRVITPEEVWWAAYLGRVGYLISRRYPSGRIDEAKPQVVLSAEWAWNLGRKKDKGGLRLTISTQKAKHDPAQLRQALRDHVGNLEKIGQQKNWIGGEWVRDEGASQAGGRGYLVI